MTARRCVAGIARQMMSTLLSESRSTQNYIIAMRARFKAAARHTSDIYPVLHGFPYQCGRPPHERNCGRPCNFLLLCPSVCLVILLVPQTLLSGGHGFRKFAPPTVPESSEDHAGGGCHAFCTERILRRALDSPICESQIKPPAVPPQDIAASEPERRALPTGLTYEHFCGRPLHGSDVEANTPARAPIFVMPAVDSVRATRPAH